MIVTDYNEQFLDKRGTDHLIDELKAYIDSIPNGNVDLSDYVTKSELQAKLDALHINIDLSAYATKEELTNAINSIDLSAYAKKTDLPIVPTKVSQLENDSNYLSSIPEEYVTETELSAKGYLTEHQDLSAYALKTEIPSIDGLATTEYVDNAIANVPSGKDGTDGITPHIDSTTKHWMIGNTDTGIVAEGVNGKDGKDGTNGSDGTNGINGTDGVSPTVTVTKEGKVATITCTDVNGTTTATISDGADGQGGGSGSGASGITYAYDTEIATGDTWLDGKPIYLKVFHIDALTTKPKNMYMKSYYEQPIFADKIVSVNTIWKKTNSNGDTYIDGNSVISPSNVATSSNYVGGNVNDFIIGRETWVTVNNFNKKSEPTFHIMVGRGTGNYDYACDVIMKYTKI